MDSWSSDIYSTDWKGSRLISDRKALENSVLRKKRAEKSCFFLFKQHFFIINNILKQFWVRYGKGQVLNFKNMFLWILFEAYSISYELWKTDVPRVALSAETG